MFKPLPCHIVLDSCTAQEVAEALLVPRSATQLAAEYLEKMDGFVIRLTSTTNDIRIEEDDYSGIITIVNCDKQKGITLAQFVNAFGDVTRQHWHQSLPIVTSRAGRPAEIRHPTLIDTMNMVQRCLEIFSDFAAYGPQPPRALYWQPRRGAAMP